MPKMQTSFSGLVTLLAKNLYTSADVFIRELIQNAHDGCQRAAALDPDRALRIDITIAFTDRTIAFADNGVGMDEADLHEYLSTIGRSGTATESARLNVAGFSPETIGQFGVGLLSAFVVAERIDVFTRKLGSPTGFHWLSHGGDEYQVSPTDEAPDCGTEITLTLKREYEHFLREEDLTRIIRLYADFLAVPIYLNGEGPVNARQAPWHQGHGMSPEERKEACVRFLERRGRDRALLVMPVDIPLPRTRGVLYITAQPIPGIDSSGMVDLYVRRMCILMSHLRDRICRAIRLAFAGVTDANREAIGLLAEEAVGSMNAAEWVRDEMLDALRLLATSGGCVKATEYLRRANVIEAADSALLRLDLEICRLARGFGWPPPFYRPDCARQDPEQPLLTHEPAQRSRIEALVNQAETHARAEDERMECTIYSEAVSLRRRWLGMETDGRRAR